MIDNENFIHSTENEAQLIDGKKIAEDIRMELREQISEWMEKGSHRAPQLTAILIGDDPASRTYVNNKMKVTLAVRKTFSYQLTHWMFIILKAAQDVGITSVTRNLSKATTEEELLEIIDELNNSDEVDGILVQLPLPDHINERKVWINQTLINFHLLT